MTLREPKLRIFAAGHCFSESETVEFYVALVVPDVDNVTYKTNSPIIKKKKASKTQTAYWGTF